MLVDNGSIYLQKLVDYLISRRAIIVRADPFKCDLRRINIEKIDGVILSGGSNQFISKKRDFNFAIIRVFRDKPIMGICLGHEFLIEYFNGILYKMNRQSKGFSYVNIIKNNQLVEIGKISVFKSHHYAAGILPDCFEQLAWSGDCENEMIEHKNRPIFGLQFHPEMSSSGKKILDNFLKLCKTAG